MVEKTPYQEEQERKERAKRIKEATRAREELRIRQEQRRDILRIPKKAYYKLILPPGLYYDDKMDVVRLRGVLRIRKKKSKAMKSF